MRLPLLGRILAAQGLSSIGTSMSTVALAFMVYKITGSVLHMGGVMAVSTFPLVVTSFVGGALLDRFSAKNLMVLADLARAVLIFVMPFVAREAVGLIYVVAAFMGIFSALFNPGQIKLIGQLVAREKLVRANSYLSVSRDGAELIGYLVGGVLVIYVGYTLTFAIDAASYLLSALLLLGLPRVVGQAGGAAAVGGAAGAGAELPIGLARARGRTGAEAWQAPGVGAAPGAGASSEAGAAPKLWPLIAEAPAVLGRLWRHPGLRTNLLFAVLPLTVVMMNVPNAYGLALEVFDRGAGGLAALEVITASGLIVGGVIISRLSLRGDKNRYVAFSLVAMGVCFIGVSFSGMFWLSVGLIGLAGVVNVWLFVPSITMFQEVPGEADKGRLISVRAGFGQMGTTGGLLLGGVLGAALGITRLFLVAGLAAIVLTLAIYVPHRIGAARRAEAARAAALATGMGRRAARAAAQAAMADPATRYAASAPPDGRPIPDEGLSPSTAGYAILASAGVKEDA